MLSARRFKNAIRSRLALANWRGKGYCLPKAVLMENAVIGEDGIIDNLQQKPDSIILHENSFCRGRLLVYAHGGRIEIGEWCYVGVRSELWSMNSIKIGNRVLISHDCNIHDGNGHSLDPTARHHHFKTIIQKGHPIDPDEMSDIASEPVVIEDDVWISFGVTILKGVRIGAGSVIAARSIVTQDVPPGVLYRNEVVPIIKAL
jgi:acetyltransferase-like isoleucine patch superfamily enzyme